MFANGRDRVDAFGLDLWASEKWRYSPYQYLKPNILCDDGQWRTLNATERELLLDFKPRHTMTCMATKARKYCPQALEDLRCGLLGDSFSCGVVAWLLQPLLLSNGYVKDRKTVVEMRRPTKDAMVSRMNDDDAALNLAQAHVLQCDPRGSDVRVDSGEIADTSSWPRRPIDPSRWRWRTDWKTRWRKQDHITLLEVLAAQLSLAWRTGRRQEVRRRFLHLIDNQASLSALAKSRSSSRALQRLLRRGAAILLAAGLRRALGYVETDTNPADAGSRE